MKFTHACCAVGVLLLASLAARDAVARGEGSGVPGQTHLALLRSAPFTEDWAAMEARDARNASAGLRRAAAARPAGSALASGAAFTPDTGFEGASRDDALAVGGLSPMGLLPDDFPAPPFFPPPDVAGAVGPDHVVELVNGVVAVFSRSGFRLGMIALGSFFSVAHEGDTYPRAHPLFVSQAVDPRVLFDGQSGRWFASALEYSNGCENQIVLSVSRTANPLGLWDKYVLPVAEPGRWTDYDTLGIDSNGVYLGFDLLTVTEVPLEPVLPDLCLPNFDDVERSRVVAIEKASLVAPEPFLGPVYVLDTPRGTEAPLPAVSADRIGPDAPAWVLLPRGRALEGGSTRLFVAPLRWRGGVPRFTRATEIATPVHVPPPGAVAFGSSSPLDAEAENPMTAVVRNQHLWTCRMVGVDETGAVTVNPDGSNSADRAACEWLQIDVSGVAPALRDSGRVFDATPFVPELGLAPRSYLFPSLAVNGQGHAAMAFTGTSFFEVPGAYVASRRSGDPPGTMSTAAALKRGEAAYDYQSVLDLDPLTVRTLWGDYSAVALDPADDMGLWTLQPYATGAADGDPRGSWSVWVGRLVPPAPVLEEAAPERVRAGRRNVRLVLRGSGFYLPPPSVRNRLAVSVLGGTPNGVRRIRVERVRPGRVDLLLDVTRGAAPGPRRVVLRNPDGQSASLAAGLVVEPPSN
jgi:hypothetical protein